MATVDRGESDIAVVGMAGRFPGAQNIDEFWRNLRDGVESIRFPSDEELKALGVDAAVLNDPHYVKAASVMDGVELFDAAFFGYMPREAELMDPQHRVFLECAWHALEHAGYDSNRYHGSIGVFGGGTTNTYLLYNLVMSNRETLQAFDPMQIDVSNGPDFVATRTSYKLNLKGPSCTVQTACSTALVAIHLACQNLLNEECDMALAGGVSVHVKHPEGYWHLDGGNVSPDGHCRAFDAQANGTIFGSGVAVVVLKRLEDAIADGDHIHAVVKGSAINNDGAMKVGFTAPSVEGQAGVIAESLALAGVKADTIRYVETHGTATKLGDPIEVRALTKAFRTHTPANGYCALGSVKTNVGHLASAAGAAGFIKTVMMLEHRLLPPSLHFEQPSPEIDFENSPFYVNTQLTEWKAGNAPRRAGVSSFGVGGTNAHAILEEAPPQEPSSASRPWQLLLLSAKTPGALEAATTNLATHLRAQPDLNLADAAYTLQVGRQAFSHRRMVVCRNANEAADALEKRDAQRLLTGATEMQDRPVVFMFPGMGDQYIDMALELYQTEPIFRENFDRCAGLLEPLLKLDMRTVLYPAGTGRREASTQAPAALETQIDLRKMLRRGDGQPDDAAQRLNQTSLAHPILFALEYALARLWMSWGLRPRSMIGHSIGEYAAACLAGVFSLEDGLTLVAKRAEMIQALPGGAMLAVLLPEEQARMWLNDRLSMATVNTPTACVVSGEMEAIADLERQLVEQGIACQRVQTSHAFHSFMMTPSVEPFRELMRQVALHPPEVPFFSNITGDWITAAEATDADYWARHLCHTVRFADGLQTLLRQPNHILLEMGPGQTLTALAKQHPEHTTAHVVLASLRQPHQQQSDAAVILGVLGRLWLAGADIDWAGFYAREKRHRVVLPAYPFERQRYWIDAKPLTAVLSPPTLTERKSDVADWFYAPTWKRSLLLARSNGNFARAELEEGQTARNPSQSLDSGVWLVVVDSAGIASGLAGRLEQAGRSVVQAVCADRFERARDGVYTFDPRKREDYTALLQELEAIGKRPNRIVHCASLTPDSPSANTHLAWRAPAALRRTGRERNSGRPSTSSSTRFARSESAQDAPAAHDSPRSEAERGSKAAADEQSDYFEALQAAGFYSLIFLAQALAEQGWVDPMQMWVVSNDVCQVESADIADPIKATILSPCTVIPQEYPHIACHYVDVSPAGSTTRWVDHLLAEMQAGSTETAIAYRGNRRWVQSFEPVHLAQDAEPIRPLREGGAYLVIDGLTGVGWALAQHLAQAARAKLVFVDHADFPDRAQWMEWLASHDEGDDIAQKIRRAQSLEEFGAQALVIGADAADAAQLQNALSQAGDLHGAIYALGSTGGEHFSPIQELDTAECERQLSPTLNSLSALTQVLPGRELDFCVLTSSLSSVLGGLGQAVHAAASLFMDALAERQNQSGRTPWLSVDWDVWRLDGAMPISGLNAPLAQFAISPEEGVEAARRLLTQLPGSQIVVSTGDLVARIRHKPQALAGSGPSGNGALRVHPRPQLASPYVAPRTELERTIAQSWQEVFGLEQIGIDDNFFELGGNSLIAIHSMSRLKKTLRVDVPTAMLYQRPTIRFLAELLAQDEEQTARQMAEQLAKRKADLSRRSQVVQRRRG